MNDGVDPVAARRARLARIVRIGRLVGYAALAVAIVAFAVGLVADFPGWTVTLTIVGLVAAIVILPAPIVLGYGIRAAEREDRQRTERS